MEGDTGGPKGSHAFGMLLGCTHMFEDVGGPLGIKHLGCAYMEGDTGGLKGRNVFGILLGCTHMFET